MLTTSSNQYNIECVFTKRSNLFSKKKIEIKFEITKKKNKHQSGMKSSIRHYKSVSDDRRENLTSISSFESQVYIKNKRTIYMIYTVYTRLIRNKNDADSRENHIHVST